MILKQVSVFLENRPGRLVDMLRVFADKGIDIHALSIAETADFGIVRMVVEDTEKAIETLKKEGFTAKVNNVLRVVVPDSPGGFLQTAAIPLAQAGINIEYVYAFVEQPRESAMVVMKVDDVERAAQVLGS